MQAFLFINFLTQARQQPPPAPQGVQRIRGASRDHDSPPGDGLGAEERQALYDAVVQEMIKVSNSTKINIKNE